MKVMEIQPEGFDELADLWKTAPNRARSLAQAVVRKTGVDLERLAKQRAPVDTGTLRNSIGTTSRLGGDDLYVEVGPTVNYGRFQEYGTSRMGPQPFMLPAADDVTPGFVAAMEQLGFEALT